MHLDSRGTLAHSKTYNVRRRDPRYVASVPVTMQRFLPSGPVVSRGLSLDVSARGMAALVCGAPRAGETVVITLALPNGLIEMLATVRHVSEGRSGFEFFPLAGRAQQGIEGWIEGLREQEEKLFPYPYAGAADLR
ncbi:MAG: PilZ domain-containing protein [Terriglobales bacterium]